MRTRGTAVPAGQRTGGENDLSEPEVQIESNGRERVLYSVPAAAARKPSSANPQSDNPRRARSLLAFEHFLWMRPGRPERRVMTTDASHASAHTLER